MIQRINTLLFSAILTTTVSASAQLDTSDISAEQHNKRAFAAVKKGDREGARTEFTKAYELSSDPKTLWNLVIAETDLHPVEALGHLRTYLAHPRAERKKKDAAKGLMAELLERTGRVTIKTPSSARALKLDGAALALAANPVDVAIGKHSIEAQFPDGWRRKEVDVHGGEDVPVIFEDSHEAPPPSTIAPPVTQPPPATQGGVPTPKREDLRESSSGTESTSNRARTLLLIGGGALAGAGLISLAVGAGFKLDQAHQSDRVADAERSLGSRECAGAAPPASGCDALHDALRARNSDSATAPAFFVSGAALLVVGAGALITGLALPARKPSEKGILVPAISPTMMGGTFATHF